MSVCAGNICECAFICARSVYNNEKTDDIVNWDSFGSTVTWTDKEGKTHYRTKYDCGFLGNFAKFVPIGNKKENTIK